MSRPRNVAAEQRGDAGSDVPLPVVRLAGREDVTAVAALRHAWACEQAGERLADASFAERFRAWYEREFDQRLTWLAHVGDAPVGMLNMLVFTRMPKPGRVESRWGYVSNVYVDQAHRDRGIGRMLLDACTSHGREQAFARLVLSPSERSVPFYTRAGFGPATSLLLNGLD